MTNFRQIKFDHAEHAYSYNGVKLMSVTTLISRVKPKFDKMKIATHVASRDSKTIEEVLDDWDKSGEEAREKGTAVHAYIEDKAQGIDDEILKASNFRYEEMNAFDSFYETIKDKAKILIQETPVADAPMGVAGTIDSILLINNKLHIFDWKTGKKFECKNKFSKMLPPFEDLDDCALTHYSIQTSLYRLILDRNKAIDGEPQYLKDVDLTKYEMADSYLLHLRNDGSYHLHRAIDYRSKIESWLENGIPEDLKYDMKDTEYVDKITYLIDNFGNKNPSRDSLSKLKKSLMKFAANLK